MTKHKGGIEWSHEHNSRFELSKSVVLHADRKTQTDETQQGENAPPGGPTLKINGQPVQKVKTFKYLGIMVDSQLSWKVQTQKGISNTTKWLLQFRRLTKPFTGVKAKLMRQLYITVAIPKMTYGLDVWYTPPSKPIGAKRNHGLVTALRGLQKAQRVATLAITGALRTTPTDVLDTHAGILPIQLTLLKATHRAATRHCTLPSSHPLHRMIQEASEEKKVTYHSPLNEMAVLFGLKPDKMETIEPASVDPHLEDKFKTTVAKTREETMEHEKHDDADFRVYTDGSGNNKEVGASAVMYKKG